MVSTGILGISVVCALKVKKAGKTKLKKRLKKSDDLIYGLKVIRNITNQGPKINKKGSLIDCLSYLV